MKTVALSSGERVPALGQGTWCMGENRAARAEEIATLRLGLDLGITLIDTAEMYGEGKAEELIGEAITGRRDQAFLVSKVYPHNATRKGAVAACERSLRRLRTDRIDLYLLHWRGSVPFAETMDAFMTLQKAGKIRHYGVSINTMEEGIAAVKDGRAETIQVEYNLLAQEPRENIFPFAEQSNVGIIARMPLKRGILTGKMSAADESRFQGEDVRARSFKGEPFQKELAKADQLRFLVHGPIKSLCQAAIAFCIAHPAVSVVIPGARNAEQMRENAAGADVEIPAADLDRVADLWRRGFTP